MKSAHRCLRVLLPLAVAGLAACAESGPEPAELQGFKPEVKVRVAWSASAGEAGEFVFSPAQWEGDYFVAGTEDGVRRIDGRTGKRKWLADIPQRLSGGVAAADGLVLVGTTRGEVQALDAATGKLRWRSVVSSEVLSAPAIADGVVVVRSGDGRISALDAADGARKWDYTPLNPPPLTIRNPFGIAISEGMVFAGLAGGRMVALRLGTGVVVWEAAVAQPKGETELERVTDVLSVPIVRDGQVCAVTYQGRAGCFDQARGTLVWARNASSAGGLATNGAALFHVDEASHLVAMDRSSGASLWKLDKFSYRELGAPAVVGRYVVAGDLEGYVHVIGEDDGRIAGRVSTDGSPIRVAAVPAGQDGFVVQTTEGKVYALSLR